MMADVLTVAHILAAVFASWRLSELVVMDKITAPLRARLKAKADAARWWWEWSSYFIGCPRCVSVWAGAWCTIVFIWLPWLNWPLALSWFCFVQWDYRSLVVRGIDQRAHDEVVRRAMDVEQRRKHELERVLTGPSVLQARGFKVPGNGR